MNSFPDCCITEEQAWLLNQSFGEHVDTYGSTELCSGFNYECIPVTLQWKDLRVSAVRKKYGSLGLYRRKDVVPIIKKVSGFVRPGELVALMGPSGAGKTTLLNVLTGRNCHGLIIEGSITVNGQSFKRRFGAMSAYVQQDNFFISSITVREHLAFQALLRLPRHMSREKKLARVEEVISEFGLMKCANSVIRPSNFNQGISGGEAKRVAFASQMLTNPSIVFCDEPTTGLDSFMAEGVVSFLQGLATRGKAVLCTIHQPPSAVFPMFHKVIILAEGRLAFFGSTDEALKFFAAVGLHCPLSYNPSDFFIHSLAMDPSNKEESTLRILTIPDRFEESQFGKMLQQTVDREPESAAQLEACFAGKMKGLHWDAFVFFEVGFPIKTWNEYFEIEIRSFLVPSVPLPLTKKFPEHWVWQRSLWDSLCPEFFALFAGLLYFQTQLNQSGIMNRNGVLFFFISHFSFPVIFTTLNVLPKEYPIFYREHQDYAYMVSSYYASKIIFFLVIYSIDGLLFLLIAYFMIGFERSATTFLLTWMITFLIEQSACSFGLLIAASCPNLPIALAIVGPILTLFQLTGGLFANVSTLPSYFSWIQYVSWFRHGYEAYLITHWHNVYNISCEATAVRCLVTGDEVIQRFGFDADNFPTDIASLVGLTTLFHIGAYFSIFAPSLKGDGRRASVA